MIRDLGGVSKYVSYTDYGRREIETSLNYVRKGNPNFEFPLVEVIPHGVDTHRFFPLNDDDVARRVEARRALKLDAPELLSAFIVLNANRNMPRHTSLADVWKNAAEFVDPVMKLTYPGNLTEGHIVTPKDVAAALQRLYEDREYRDAMAQAAYLNATRSEFKWSAAVAQWKKLFDETIDAAAASAL